MRHILFGILIGLSIQASAETDWITEIAQRCPSPEISAQAPIAPILLAKTACIYDLLIAKQGGPDTSFMDSNASFQALSPGMLAAHDSILHTQADMATIQRECKGGNGVEPYFVCIREKAPASLNGFITATALMEIIRPGMLPMIDPRTATLGTLRDKHLELLEKNWR